MGRQVTLDFQFDIGDTCCHATDKEQSVLYFVTGLEANICHGGCVQKVYTCRILHRKERSSWSEDIGYQYGGTTGVSMAMTKCPEMELVAYDPEKDPKFADEDTIAAKLAERQRRRAEIIRSSKESG